MWPNPPDTNRHTVTESHIVLRRPPNQKQPAGRRPHSPLQTYLAAEIKPYCKHNIWLISQMQLGKLGDEGKPNRSTAPGGYSLSDLQIMQQSLNVLNIWARYGSGCLQLRQSWESALHMWSSFNVNPTRVTRRHVIWISRNSSHFIICTYIHVRFKCVLFLHACTHSRADRQFMCSLARPLLFTHTPTYTHTHTHTHTHTRHP